MTVIKYNNLKTKKKAYRKQNQINIGNNINNNKILELHKIGKELFKILINFHKRLCLSSPN